MFDYIITHIQVCHYTYTRIKNLFDCHSSSCCPLLGSSSGSSPGLILICPAGPVLLFLLPLSSLLIFPGCSCPLGTDISGLSLSFSGLVLFGWFTYVPHFCLCPFLEGFLPPAPSICTFMLLYTISYYRSKTYNDNVYYMIYTIIYTILFDW